eukprot:2525494-Ditylum_brightwellii.AAC.2
MEYCMAPPNRGWTLKPECGCDGKGRLFKFRVKGIEESDYANCLVTRRSVSVYSTFLQDAPITLKSVLQKTVALSVTEAETISRVQCTQNMLYTIRLLEHMGLQIDVPMMI